LAPQKSSLSTRVAFWVASLTLLLALLLGALVFWPRTPVQRPSFVNVTVGNELFPEVEERGFHFQEYDVGQPFRWTDGNARLVIPIDRTKPPETLLVQVTTYRKRGVGSARLEVVVNGHSLFKDAIR